MNTNVEEFVFGVLEPFRVHETLLGYMNFLSCGVQN